MNWLEQLLFDSNSIAHIVLLYTAVISLGVYLGKIKFFGISLGVTFVLFAGILAGHFGFTGPVSTLNFLQDFGLILFVYCIGLQVGPGFFESFKKGGVTLNLLACGIVALNILVISILRGIWEYTTVPRQAMPMVNAIGIPKTSSMINIDASITSTFTLLLPETAFTAVSAFLSLPSDDPDSI